ncbi:unnamed protein product [Rotaria sordida]|uniref:Helicase ATP-binding domain-containing protein n=1 Tax=Rotaria sordida TaxID=392033 RepID=A0A814LYK5_9BILA|nr:unnamed protein product [Rotaria sordida]
MASTKQFIRSDFDILLHSFVDENQFPWLDPSLHERQLTTHDIDINRLFTIETLNDDYDLVADRNLTTGEIIGLCEIPIIPKPVININLEDDPPLYPNEYLQPAPISCPCLSTTINEISNETNQDLETIINRNDTDVLLSNNDNLLKSLSNEDGLGMDLSSTIISFKPNIDNQYETFLHKWKSDLDDINLQSTFNQQQQSSIMDAPIPSKLRLGSLFDIPLPELKFRSTTKDINKTAEQQLNRSYAIELNPNEKLGDFRLRVPDMAIQYPFELDTFQKQAILRLENNESVFVAAHTSAGKTVVAEYAIALAQNHSTKAFYTSPIKALSNQKYCDFKKRFNDVGLLTGDVQINHEASCLIMTTEILRSMLYNRSNTLKSLEWVIMDEIHYLNDTERGFVWEEVLIMLPDHVGLIMLSATVSNAREFAEWVGRMKRRNVYVISTFKRPVPLEHFLYTGNSTSTNKELFMLIDAEQKFLERNHAQAVAAKAARQKDRQQNFGSKTRYDNLNTNQNKTLWTSTIYVLRDKQLLPVVCFVFSRKRCDDYLELVKGLDLNSQEDKHYVSQFFRQALSRLNRSKFASNRFILLNDFLTKTSQLSLLNNLHELNLKLENEIYINVNENFHHIRKLKFYENKYNQMNERLLSLQTNLQTSYEYESMLEVLKKLNYITNINILSLKGQVAALFGSGKELLLTELIYQNLIDYLTPSEIAALLSSIIFQGKRFDNEINDDNQKKEITPSLHQAKQQLIAIASRLDQIQRDYKIPTNIEDELNFSIMSLVYKWAQGAKFYDIMNDPDMEIIDIQEGTIVRTIMRIEELCSDIRNAGKTVGNSELVDKLNQVTTLIKRGIVFAPSLYFSETITTL